MQLAPSQRLFLKRLFTTVSVIGLAGFVVITTWTQALRHDLNPTGSFVSDYLNGPYGSLETVAFVSLAAGGLALWYGLQQADWLPRLGWIGLLVWNIAMVVAGFTGSLRVPHTIAAWFAFLAFPIAAMSTSHYLSKMMPQKASFRVLWVLAIITLASLIGGWFIISAGIGERIIFASNILWQAFLALLLMRNTGKGQGGNERS
jgi:Protein of unknown function (DUF998)